MMYMTEMAIQRKHDPMSARRNNVQQEANPAINWLSVLKYLY